MKSNKEILQEINPENSWLNNRIIDVIMTVTRNEQLKVFRNWLISKGSNFESCEELGNMFDKEFGTPEPRFQEIQEYYNLNNIT